MMNVETCTWNGTTATVYLLDNGEKVLRHRHTVDHTTMVINGLVVLEIWKPLHGEPSQSQVLAPHHESMTLPAGYDHEITAEQNGTIVLNMIEGVHDSANAGYLAEHGGVMLHDGTVVR